MDIIKEKPVPSYILIRQYVIGIATRPENHGTKIMSIRKMCKLFNVSHPTVMKALNVLIKEGVLITRPGMGTYINSKSFIPFTYSSKKQLKIGLIISTGKLVHYDYYYLKLLSGISSVLSNNAVFVEFVNPMEINEKLADILKIMQLDGVIWLNPPEDSNSCLKAIDASDIPLVSVYSHNLNMSKNNVTANYVQAGNIAGKALIKNGHKNILHVCNNYSSFNETVKDKSINIIKGLKAAYKENNINIDNRYFLIGGEEMLDKIEEMIDKGTNITAIFVEGNFCSPVCELLKKKKIAIPKDITIITIKDTFSVSTDFKVIYIEMPLEQMAIKACETLLALMKTPSKSPVNIVLEWKIQ